MNKQNKRDYYEVLGISRNASSQEIKTAYRRLAKKYHPDVSKEKDAAKKFKEVNEAYQVLSDTQKKATYDQFGHKGMNFNNQGQGFDFGNFDFSDIFNGFSDIFGNSSRSQRRTSKNTKYKINLTFFEAMEGCQKSFNLKVETVCPKCRGNGAENINDLVKCHQCNGHGQEVVNQKTIFGYIRTQRKCSKCNGNGEEILHKCKNCKGKKIVFSTKTINIDVPRGVQSNQSMIIKNKGHIDLHTKRQGDLYIIFEVEENGIFKREENDLFCVVPVSYLDALLGNRIKIPTLEGSKYVDLDEYTKNNKIIRLRKFGAYDPNNQRVRGDLYIKINIQFPDKLSRHQKVLLKELDINENFTPNDDFINAAQKKGFIKK